jgi:dTDP-4-dehydrorhamnose reductase
MRVLLLGGQGQVGHELARQLPGTAQVIAPSRAQLDLSDAAALERTVREAKPQLILNAAAYTAVDKAEADEPGARAANAQAPAILAAEAKRSGAFLVHYSTDYVFDGSKATAYVEEDPTAPLGAYGRSKLEGEQAITASGCAHLILRTSWVYAARGRNFVLTMLRLGEAQKALRVVADQRGSPTSARDLARATLQILDLVPGAPHAPLERARAAQGIYHATGGGATTWHAFAQQIFSEWAWLREGRFVAPHVQAIATTEYPTPARRPANSVLSNDKLQRVFKVRLPAWRAGLGGVLAELNGAAA